MDMDIFINPNIRSHLLSSNEWHKALASNFRIFALEIYQKQKPETKYQIVNILFCKKKNGI